MKSFINYKVWDLWHIPVDAELYMHTITYDYIGKEVFDALSSEEKSYYVPDYEAIQILDYLDKNLGIRITVRSCDNRFRAMIDLDGKHFETENYGIITLPLYDITCYIVNYFYDKKIKETYANY